MTLNENGNGFFLGDRAGLVCKGQSGIKRDVSIWLLTRLGMQVASLLKPTNELAALARLATFIDKTGLTQIISGPILRPNGQGDGPFQIPTLFVHWDAENDKEK